MSPGLIVAPPTSTGTSSAPDDVLARPPDADVARPDRQPELDELVEVAHRGVDEHRGRAVDLGLRREQVADERVRARLGHRQHEDLARLQRAIAAWTMRLSACPHATVRAGPATRLPGMIWMRSAST